MTKKYRNSVSVAVFNKNKDVLVCRRVNETSNNVWQFPQGEIEADEDVVSASRRELREETGIISVKHIMSLREPLKYDFPEGSDNWQTRKGFSGQSLSFNLFYFFGQDKEINLNYEERAEFSAYKWVEMKEAPLVVWHPKREVYEKALEEFAPVIDKFFVE